MLLHLMTVFAAGIFAALCTFLVARNFKGIPKYVIPVMGGLAMICYAVWSEYSWASRTTAALPDHIKVAKVYTSNSPFAPWTYIFPRADRMMLVDISRHKKNSSHPDIVLTELVLVKRFQPTARVAQLFDCKANKRADVPASNIFIRKDFSVIIKWQPLEKGSNLIQAACVNQNKV